MSRAADPSIDSLNREWTQLQSLTVPARWRVQELTLADLLSAVGDDPDRVLGTLLRVHADGDALAGRVVLQAMLGKLVLLAVHDPYHAAAEYIAECWLQLCQYPLARRPARIAANLALDTRRAVWASPTPAVSTDPLAFDEMAQPGSVDTIALIRTATRLGLIDHASGACLVAVYCLGLRSHEAAAYLAISPQLVRWRNARSIRRLAPHAVTLAAVA